MRAASTGANRWTRGPMALVAILTIGLSACTSQSPGDAGLESGVTIFEGARLITGHAQPPIENAAFVVQADRIVEVGRAGGG